MSIIDELLNLFRKKEIPSDEQYVHKEFCEQGRLVQSTCESYRVYDNENKPIVHPSCAMLPPDVNIVGDNAYVVEQTHKE
jgi:hypothetical protein